MKLPERIEITWERDKKTGIAWVGRHMRKVVLSVWRGSGGWYWTRVTEDLSAKINGPFADGHAACEDA